MSPGAAVRQHWSIENSQHLVQDVTFAEVRRLVLSVLQQEKSHQRGAKYKRFTCAIDPEFLNKVRSFTKNSSDVRRRPGPENRPFFWSADG